jgi:hypothetical protein
MSLSLSILREMQTAKLFRDVARIATFTGSVTFGESWDVLLSGGVPHRCDILVNGELDPQVFENEGIHCHRVDETTYIASSQHDSLVINITDHMSGTGVCCIGTCCDLKENGKPRNVVRVYDSHDPSDGNNLYFLKDYGGLMGF